MVFFSRGNSAIPTFTYDSTPLELVTEFKYLGITLTRDGSMLTAAKKIADNFRSAIARIRDNKGIKHRKYALLWLFQVSALTAGLYGCQVWTTSSLTYDSSKITPTHILHLGFLKNSWASRKVLILTACSAKQVRCPFFLLIQVHHTFPEQFTLFKQSSS